MPNVKKNIIKKGKLSKLEQKQLLLAKKNKKTKVILLKYHDNRPLIWFGTNKEHKTTNESRLVLQLDNDNFYFYLSGIKKTSSHWGKNWINFKTKLDYNNQISLLKELPKLIDQENLYQQSLLLKLKIDFLINQPASFNPKNIDFKNQADFLFKKIMPLSRNLDLYYENFEIKTTEVENFSKVKDYFTISMKNYQQEVDILFEPLNQLFKNFETLPKDFQGDHQVVSELKQETSMALKPNIASLTPNAPQDLEKLTTENQEVTTDDYPLVIVDLENPNLEIRELDFSEY
ncbi:MAG: hypothetical protein REH79_03115 [Spiroplasma sp.]|nr:hypothetical protein [Spiroplasma sp.]